MTADVAVIGGGIIGLSIAWRLLQRGVRVTVLERDACRDEASAPLGQATWAAAGALAALGDTPEPLRPFAKRSLGLYPAFVAEVAEESGRAVGLEGEGLLRLADSTEAIAVLREEYLAGRACGHALQWLDDRQVEAAEPVLSPNRRQGYLSPAERRVDPRRLARALAAAVERRGGSLLDGRRVTRFRTVADRVGAVESEGGALDCEEVILAAGAWTGRLSALLGATLPVRPIRGQVMRVRPEPVPRHTLQIASAYLVPDLEGHWLVSAVEEDAGFESEVTAEGLSVLTGALMAVSPGAAKARFIEAWAGLRPASPDGLPILGRLPGIENALVATGHFRKGILLAPATAEAMMNLLLDRRVSSMVEPFRPGRFQAIRGQVADRRNSE